MEMSATHRRIHASSVLQIPIVLPEFVARTAIRALSAWKLPIAQVVWSATMHRIAASSAPALIRASVLRNSHSAGRALSLESAWRARALIINVQAISQFASHQVESVL